MSFQPTAPLGGYGGWKALQRTLPVQKAAFAESGEAARNVAAFKEKIATVKTAEDLVGDRQLLKVALGAFGLQDDINNRYFITRILSDGSTDPKDLANRLSNKSYLEMTQTFGFGDGEVLTGAEGFAEFITARYLDRQFEVALGDSNESFRFAMNAERELSGLAEGASSETVKWLNILSAPPLREVFETAFGLPGAFGAADLDFQLRTVRERAENYLGSADVAQFSDPAQVEKLIRLYLARSDSSGGQAGLSGAAIAAQLLAGR